MKDGLFESITLKGIRAWGHHGANAGEQEVAQPLDLEIDLSADVQASRTSDELADTVDYAKLHALVVRIVETERYRLLERLAESILTAIMADERIATAAVTIAKPGLLSGATPGVRLSKFRVSKFSGKTLRKRDRKKKR